MTTSSWHLGGIWDARFLLFIQASELSNPDPPAPRAHKKLDPSGGWYKGRGAKNLMARSTQGKETRKKEKGVAKS